MLIHSLKNAGERLLWCLYARSNLAKSLFYWAMSKNTKTATKRRTAPKEERRLQLIKATIRSIARHGLSDTTMATVTREAKLSQGIVNLHFQSKERLLVETLRHVADEYTRTWEKALENAGPSSTERLLAIVDADFARPVCEQNKLAVWFAFWGESKSRPTYRKICAERDQRYQEMLVGLCSDIVAEGPYPNANPEAIATGLDAMGEGLWLDMLVSPEIASREQSKAICLAFLASVFPKHFRN
jgi:TetR/AcrR family transcriptional repressor of bet genes